MVCGNAAKVVTYFINAETHIRRICDIYYGKVVEEVGVLSNSGVYGLETMSNWWTRMYETIVS